MIHHFNRSSWCYHLCLFYGNRVSLPIANQQPKSFLSSCVTSRPKKSFKLVTLIHEPYATHDAWHPTIPPPPESGPTGCCTWSSLFSDPISKPIIIDVRSPDEFNEDHIHGAINIPILNNEERAIVGRLYNQEDRVQARLYGASLVCANISRCLKELAYQYGLQLDNSVPVNHHFTGNRKVIKYPDFFIYCWRGGQRSNSLATILSEVGWPGNIYTLVGGYRSWRRLLLRQLDAWPRWSILSPFWVISGLTGSGKSLILQELHNYGETVFDLEALAKHKGSMFGGGNVLSDSDTNYHQSTTNKGSPQKFFESQLHHVIMTNKHRLSSCKNILWIECESRYVGPVCGLSDGLWSRLRSTDPNVGTHRIWIDITEEARVAWILENYSTATRNVPQILAILKSLNEYIPNKLINQWTEMIHREDFTSFVTGLLRHHYDPLYIKNRHQMMEDAKNNGLFHRISLPNVDKTMIQTRIIPQILDLAYTTTISSDINQHRLHHLLPKSHVAG